MQVNTVIGVFNPLLMLAGFGINKSLTVYENRQKEMASLECLKLSIQTAKEKVKHLEEAYLLCKAAIAKYVSLCVHSDRKKHGKEIQKIVGEFVTKDWLKIEENV